MSNKRASPFVGAENKRNRAPDPAWLLHLREKGWAVIENILPEERTEEYKTRFWDWIEGFGTGIDRKSPSSWTAHNWPPSTRGIIQHYGGGHSKFVWDLRSEDAVIDIFATIWRTYELLVSFDGLCLAKPAHIDVEAEKDSWAHLDQGPRRAGKFECVQGLMTFTEAGPGLGGLIVYEGSHAIHEKFFERFPDYAKKIGTSDWCKLEPKHREWYFRHGCAEVQPSAPAGSIILWDSRTVHWAVRPKKMQKHCRMAIYLCFVPRSKANQKNLQKKQAAFTNRRMTSHWPAQPRLFTARPRDWGDATVAQRFPDQPTITDAEVTDLIRQLAGF